jgi:hypothetical protein
MGGVGFELRVTSGAGTTGWSLRLKRDAVQAATEAQTMPSATFNLQL